MKNIVMSQFTVFIWAIQLTDNTLYLSSAMTQMKNMLMTMITGSLLSLQTLAHKSAEYKENILGINLENISSIVDR
jgi:hypothetical protein